MVGFTTNSIVSNFISTGGCQERPLQVDELEDEFLETGPEDKNDTVVYESDGEINLY